MRVEPNAKCALCGIALLVAVDPRTKQPYFRWRAPDGGPACGTYCQKAKPKRTWPPQKHARRGRSMKGERPE